MTRPFSSRLQFVHRFSQPCVGSPLCCRTVGSEDPAVLNTSETTVEGDGYLSEGWQRRRVGESGVFQFRCTDTVYVRIGIGIGASRAVIASSP